MMNTRNSKIASKKFAEDRERAAQDKTRFTAEQLKFLEVGPGYAVKGNDERVERLKQFPVNPSDPGVPTRAQPGRMGLREALGLEDGVL